MADHNLASGGSIPVFGALVQISVTRKGRHTNEVVWLSEENSEGGGYFLSHSTSYEMMKFNPYLLSGGMEVEFISAVCSILRPGSEHIHTFRYTSKTGTKEVTDDRI